MIIDNRQNPHSICWFVNRAKFIFEDKYEYRRWMRGKQIHFKFDPQKSMDSGECILESPGADSSRMFPVTPDIADIEIELGIEGPTITAMVDLPVELREDVDGRLLEHWAEELAGYLSAELTLGRDSVYQDFDHGTGFRLIETDPSGLAPWGQRYEAELPWAC